MALTISIEGLGVIANADNATTDTATGGSWGFSGSGGVSNGITTDTYLYGSASYSAAFSGTKSGWVYYNHGSQLNFSTTYANQFIYIWVHCPTIGLTSALSNPGVAIQAGTDTSNYRTWSIAGNDDANDWNGGWKCVVLDPTKTGSITDTGTYSASTVQYIGAYMSTTATAKGDNLFISQIAVGSGLRVTGTSTTAWDDAVVYCTDYPNRAWGMLQEREGIYYGYGNMNIGDTTAATDFSDSARVLQYGVSEYWSGSAWVSTMPTTASGITLDDGASTNTTTFTDGVAVGTDNGRSGSTFIGNSNENIFFDSSSITNAGSALELYGTTMQSFYGGIDFADDTDNDVFGCAFIDSAQVDPVGAGVIRNCTFAETSDADSALLWNESINIQSSAFIANTTGAGIEHPSAAGTPYTYTGLSFSGNTFDVLNSSGSPISINVAGTGVASTSEGSSVTFIPDPVTVSVHVNDHTGADLQNANVYMEASDGTGDLPYNASVTSITRAGTTATVTFGAAHNLNTGEYINLSGITSTLNQKDNNGAKQVTYSSATVVTYTTIDEGDTTYSGTITATGGLLYGLTDVNGDISKSRTLTSDQPLTGFVRKSSASPRYKTFLISGTLETDVDLSISVRLVLDE